LLGLDAERMTWAIGNAATQAGGLVESLGTPAKSLGVGNAARHGLWSALLAEKGFSGPERPIEGTQGFLHAMGEAPDWNAFTDGIGETWEILQNTYKPYPCGIVIHPVIDCVLQLRAEHALRPDEVERIVVRGNPLLAQRTDRPEVTTGREAQVSVQHSVAVALLFGKAGLEQYTDDCVRDRTVSETRRKVQVERDESVPVQAASVQVFTKDGRHHTVSVPFARGSTQSPLTDQELETKFRSLAAGWRPNQDMRPLIEAIWELDRSGDAAGVLALSVPRG
jgi:2-methylcitrate dehydratase PrpD